MRPGSPPFAALACAARATLACAARSSFAALACAARSSFAAFACAAAIACAAALPAAAAPAPGAAGAATQPPPHGSAGSGSQPGTTPAGPPPVPVPLGTALRWRLVGPFRGGRVLAVSGVPGRRESFYFGAVGGGVWRSADAGRVWTPVFDGPPSGSIGALAVAPSNPDVVYVGTGEADMRSDISYGDGMYRSTDGGRTFQAIGLRDSRQIGRILVDPHDPDVVLVAVLGHGFGPNAERGVFRSADGGGSWQRVLHRDDDTGAIDLTADPDHPRTIYAALWNTRRPPWSTYAPLGGTGGGIFRSSDGGLTWSEIAGHGLPAGPLGRIGLAFAGATPFKVPDGDRHSAEESPGTVPAGGGDGHGASGNPGERGRTVYALIDDPHQPGLYRSDDAGQSWRRAGDDPRITSRSWYFGGLTADPVDPETIYVANVSLYRSTDGGRTFAAIKGAPGGDDYHALWIDPAEPGRMILGGDQGAVVSVDGGATWSSWFNQPTAQLYHAATDDRYPYTIYGSQQDSGTVATLSRSDAGQITYRDWFSTGTGESGYILPDPTDPDAVYGGNPGGQLFRFSRRTSQVLDVSPTPGPPGFGAGAAGGPAGPFRYPWTPALAISPHPPHALYQGSQYVHRSTDRGASWTVISPDLTAPARGQEGARTAGGDGGDGDGAAGKAVVYSIAPSPLREGQIWAGTDDSLIHLTIDEGTSWRNVTPPGLPAWSMVSLVEASRYDAGTAYVAIDRHQMDDLRPYALRTRDFGKTWTPIVAGIAATAYLHAIREDPERRGLLYAGTETGVYLSFDDGDHWQPLQLNLPAASVRDLAIHGNDLIAATHGRSFWVLDGLAPLRQLDAAVAAAPVHLFTPSPAIRKRRGESRETVLPPETPAGRNPPAGALIDYWLAAGPEGAPAGDVTLEIRDERGELVRRFASGDPGSRREDAERLPLPTYWLRPAPPLSRQAGLNRFVWDLRYSAPPALHPEASADAVFGEDTPFEPEPPFVLPGTYQLQLTAGGRSATASLRVETDPRVQVPFAALASQLTLSRRIDAALAESYQAVQQLRDLVRRLDQLPTSPAPTAQPPSPASGATSPDSPRRRPAHSGAGSPDGANGLAGAVAALRRKAGELAGRELDFLAVPEKVPSLTTIHLGLAALAVTVGSGDAAPTAQATAAFSAYRVLLDRQVGAWSSLRATDLPALDRRLAAAGLHAVDSRP
jgi:hypothetical protein